MRSEGNRLLEGIDEVIRISAEAKVPAEIYHFKAAGKANWPRMDQAIARVEAARKKGLAVTANMYCYTAGATGWTPAFRRGRKTAAGPPCTAGCAIRRSRQRVVKDIRAPKPDWPNFYGNAGSPDKILLTGFKTTALKRYQGKTLAEVAKMRRQGPGGDADRPAARGRFADRHGVFPDVGGERAQADPDAVGELRLGRGVAGAEGVFLKRLPHPRAYGNFARLLGKYVREEKLLPLEEAVRRLTSLPATNLGLENRGLLKEGHAADVVVFDAMKIADKATYEKPQQYAVGVRHVFVNGVQVIKEGEHTGARPGKALWGPGKRDK